MAFKITNFLSNLQDQAETSRADKFDVMIVIPNKLTSLMGMETLSLVCEATELPEVGINPIEFINYGFVQRIPFHLTFAPIALTFICTGKMKEKIFFDTWVNNMIPFNNGLIYYPDDNNYKTSIKIIQYNLTGKPIYTVDLQEAFPLNVSSLPLSWSNDQIHRLTVNFSYKRWNSEATQTVGALSDPSNLSSTQPTAGALAPPVPKPPSAEPSTGPTNTTPVNSNTGKPFTPLTDNESASASGLPI